MAKSSNGSKVKTRVPPADDHQSVHAGIRPLLESVGDLQVVAEADDGEEAQTLIRKYQPDVAVPDIQMVKASGIETKSHHHTTNPARQAMPAISIHNARKGNNQ